MEDIVVKLLEDNDYRLIGSVPEIGIFTYESNAIKDVVIVAPYSTGDLNAFDRSDITHSVMAQFDLACTTNPNALKDTSLIMCHRVEGATELAEVKNTTLKIEENTYGFRKYVLPYTSDSIQGIAIIDDLMDELPRRLEEGFSAYAESSVDAEISEYETILRIYSKLPFLNYVREDNDWNSLEGFLQERLKEYVSVRQLIEDYSSTQTYGKTTDEEIDELLNDEEVKNYFIKSRGEQL